jgi:hypothetical protein
MELKDWLRKKYSVEIESSVPYVHMATAKAGVSAKLHGQEWLQADA